MRYHYKRTLVFLLLIGGSLVFINANTGPADRFGVGYTGAPFDNNGSFCSDCHGGGAFTPIVTVQLLSGSTPVTSFVPGNNYTVRVTVSSSTGVTFGTRYGFQIMAVDPDEFDIDNWGTLPGTMHSTFVGNRTYIEHSSPLFSGIINIPWTAPTSGDVTFYAAGNVVNNDVTPSNDNPTTTSVTFQPNPLPVTWLYFKGIERQGHAYLQWATSDEVDNARFILESSTDGERFQEIASITPERTSDNTHEYAYTDPAVLQGKAYYRISQQDIDGKISTYRTIQLSADSKATVLHYIDQGHIIVQMHTEPYTVATATLRSVTGQVVARQQVIVQTGSALLSMDKPTVAGMYILTVHTPKDIIYTGKVLVQ